MTKKNSPSVIHCRGGGREEDEKETSLNATDERELIQKTSLKTVPEVRLEDSRNRQRQILLGPHGASTTLTAALIISYCQLHFCGDTVPHIPYLECRVNWEQLYAPSHSMLGLSQCEVGHLSPIIFSR